MKIISNFKDYYDGIQKYGSDSQIRYRRITEKGNIKPHLPPVTYVRFPAIKKENSLLPELSVRAFTSKENVNLQFEPFIVFFCNKMYTGIRTLYQKDLSLKADLEIKWAFQYSYTYAAFLAECERLKFDYVTLRASSTRMFSFRKSEAAETEEFFALSGTLIPTQSSIATLMVSLQVPVLYFQSHGTGNCKEPTFTHNPELFKIDFIKVMPPYLAFQELEMYIGGVLSAPETPMIPITDKDRIQQRGFDKWSFRKMPTKKVEKT